MGLSEIESEGIFDKHELRNVESSKGSRGLNFEESSQSRRDTDEIETFGREHEIEETFSTRFVKLVEPAGGDGPAQIAVH